jgi:hypothetical protein
MLEYLVIDECLKCAILTGFWSEYLKVIYGT